MSRETAIMLTENDTMEYVPAAVDFVREAYKLLKECDFQGVATLRNGNIESIRALKEFQARAEFAAKQIKEFLAQVCTPCEDDLPKGISWSKQSYTTTFADPLAAAFKLIELENTPMENFLRWLTPKQAAEAAGITEDRLRSDLDGMIVDKPKARVLSIK